MHRSNYVKVRVVCDRCTQAFPMCFPIERHVPDEDLICTPGGAPVGPGGGGGGSGLLCSVCGLRWASGVSELQQMVNDATRRGWGEHMRNGAVVLRLPA